MQNDKKDTRHYAGAAGIFTLIILLLMFLSYVEIPPVNKDLFVAIVGTLVSSLGIVVYVIIGQQPDEVTKLQKKNESLETATHQMEKRNDQLEEMIIEMQAKMIQKLTFFGSQCSCGKDNCECKTK
jgi:predicted urease superfamily metal-dependent hydrolase|tara:strand:+ start:503 stop:880 length:378 start_codon:yes stop_codon:yes gene_type:complete